MSISYFVNDLIHVSRAQSLAKVELLTKIVNDSRQNVEYL